MDVKYLMQKAHNVRRSKRMYDREFTREQRGARATVRPHVGPLSPSSRFGADDSRADLANRALLRPVGPRPDAEGKRRTAAGVRKDMLSRAGLSMPDGPESEQPASPAQRNSTAIRRLEEIE